MDWIQVITIIFSLAGLIYWFKSDLGKDISRLDTEIRELGNKVDTEIRELSNKVDNETKAQTARTDQLYQMFIDLLKEKTKTTP